MQTLEQQQANLISYLPRAISTAVDFLRNDPNGEIGQRLADRLASGFTVFGDGMYKMPLAERREEAVEELVDFLIWWHAYQHGVDHGDAPVSEEVYHGPHSLKAGDRVLFRFDGSKTDWRPASVVGVAANTFYQWRINSGGDDFEVLDSEVRHA